MTRTWQRRAAGTVGLVALEAGVEPERGIGGFVASPFVIVRVREGSPAQGLLPAEVAWTRGRRPDERVAILKPKLPTLALTQSLVERLAGLFAGQRPRSSRISAGRSASTAKPAKVEAMSSSNSLRECSTRSSSGSFRV